MADNEYIFLILELGIAILDNDNKILHFKKFHDPSQSHLKIKLNDFTEISEALEFFKSKPSVLVTNYPSLVEFLKSNSERVEKISPDNEVFLKLELFELVGAIGPAVFPAANRTSQS